MKSGLHGSINNNTNIVRAVSPSPLDLKQQVNESTTMGHLEWTKHLHYVNLFWLTIP
jgi:hypothetical protein